MDWQYLRQDRGQDVQSFIEEFRKHALNLDIALDPPEVLTKYIGSLHSYHRHSLLLFEPTTIDSTSVKTIHLENGGKNERDDHLKKPPFKPPNGKPKVKGKGKEKRTPSTKKDEGERTYFNHCKKEGHDDDHCWKQYQEKRPKKYGGKGKQKTVATMQQDLGSDSGDEALITTVGTKGTLTPHVNYESHEGTSSIDESLPNERKRIELFHIRVIINHTKVETLLDTGSQANLISESLVKKLGLETKPHPKPYPLGWIHDKAKLNVTKECKVKFVIASKLVDEVKLDVIPLDICGMVLGSPYLYDRKEIFFCHENKYQITKDGVEYIVRAHQTKINANLVSAGQMKRLVNSSKGCMLMIEPKGLPPKREIQHEIHLQHDVPLPNIGMYRMSTIEMEDIKKQVHELLNQGVIRPSTSPCGILIVLMPKKDGTWRMCVDYRALNKITVKNRYPLPRIDDLLYQLKNPIYFTKSDLRSGYHQVRIAKQDVWKTAFKTKQGLFECMVMPFELYNAPATFMRVMNDLFRPFIDEFVLVYLDDILIFSKSWNEHVCHVKKVFDVLKNEELYVKLSKSEFGKTSLVYLGHIVGHG
eukprot:PITA_32964